MVKTKEYGNVSFHYRQTSRSENYDFYSPTELAISAKNENEKLNLTFTIINEVKGIFQNSLVVNIGLALVICGALGKIKRYHIEGDKKI
ncbi:MAG: hypothetical protein V5A68_06510 [Candidatus Thermoplasmatota archaeon]